MSSREQLAKQVERIVASHVLHGSESLCKLLQYLARHVLDHPAEPIKEYQIATEVLGRPAGFDPQTDSVVRVQAGRLRSKLAEYYASDGVNDPILIELPKGSYILTFHHRAESEPNVQAISLDSPARGDGNRRFMMLSAILSVLLLGCLGIILSLLLARRVTPASQTSQAKAPPVALKTFWNRFAAGPVEPWVIFSNAAFVGRPETGMRYYDASKDASAVSWDHYTGVGEVLAIHSLDQAFSQLHRSLRVKRGSLFSLDDAENNDLIFVGSPSENLTLQDIPNTKEFVFQRVADGPRKGDLGLVSVHPRAGEPSQFLASPSGTPLAEDYAVIGFMPGLNPSRSVMILAGTTTFGTQAAVEYVSREDSVQKLLTRLAIAPGQDLEPFEAVIHATIKRGVPVEIELVTVRKRQR